MPEHSYEGFLSFSFFLADTAPGIQDYIDRGSEVKCFSVSGPRSSELHFDDEWDPAGKRKREG